MPYPDLTVNGHDLLWQEHLMDQTGTFDSLDRLTIVIGNARALLTAVLYDT